MARRQQRDATALQTQLVDRFAAAQARGELLHAREAALFALELGDSVTALKLARQNWNDQREPADLRLLASAARAATMRRHWPKFATGSHAPGCAMRESSVH